MIVGIILAGGIGTRFKEEKPKQIAKIAGKTVIEHTLDIFETHSLIDEIYVIINPEYYELMFEIAKNYKKLTKILYGGETRQESSKIGIFALENKVKKVLIHDAVRPFVKKETISEVIKQLDNYSAVDVAIPASDTIIKVDESLKFVERVPERRYLFRGQTPQGFRKEVIIKAHKLAEEDGFSNASDDISLIVKYKLGDIYVIRGDDTNIKITYPQDIYIADRLFQLKSLSICDILNDKKELQSKLTSLKDKVIVVFGGTSGIGKEIVKISRNYDAKVYSFSKRTGVDITSYRSVKEALESIFKEEKKIDAVISSAGVLRMGFLENISVNDIKYLLKVNFLGQIYVSKASIPYLKQSFGSLILFASSSYTRGRAGYSAYSSSKAGLVNFSQGIADELSGQVRVNVINPERTNTPMRKKNFGNEPEEILLNPKSVAYVTLIIANSDITGHIIDVRKSDEKILNNYSC